MIVEVTLPKLPRQKWGPVGITDASKPLLLELDLTNYLGKATWSWAVHKSSKCKLTKTPTAADRQATDAELAKGKIFGNDLVLWVRRPGHGGWSSQLLRLSNFFGGQSGVAISLMGGKKQVGQTCIGSYWGTYCAPKYEYAVKGRWRRIPRWKVDSDTRLWVGLGIQGAASRIWRGGGALALTLSLDQAGRLCVFGGAEVGVGATVGRSWGACLVVVTNVKNPYAEIDGIVQGGIDYSVTLGQRFLKGKAGAGGLLKVLKPLMQRFGKNLGRSPEAIRAIVVALIRNRDSLAGGVKSMFAASGLDAEERNIMFIALPGLGGGAELGVFLKVESFKVLYAGTDRKQVEAAVRKAR